MTRRQDIADLLAGVTDSQAVQWGDFGPTWENHTEPTIQRNIKRVHHDPLIYLPLPGEVAAEPWEIHLGVIWPGDSDSFRRFQTETTSFVTTEDGSVIWVEPDAWAWVYEDPAYDPTRELSGHAIVGRAYKPLSHEEYGRILRQIGVDGTLRVEAGVSTQLLNQVLEIWTKAFCGIDITYNYNPRAPKPYWVQSLEETLDAEPGTLLRCETSWRREGALLGESEMRCWRGEAAWINPDGKRVCDEHRHPQAVPLNEEARP